jgi:putative addiction module component (TIGR02574 family)
VPYPSPRELCAGRDLNECALLEKGTLRHMLSHMNDDLRKLPLDERIRLVEDLWDSIAADQNLLPLTPEQRAELDRRLAAYEADGNPGRLAEDVIAEIKKKL